MVCTEKNWDGKKKRSTNNIGQHCGCGFVVCGQLRDKVIGWNSANERFVKNPKVRLINTVSSAGILLEITKIFYSSTNKYGQRYI